MDYVTLVIRIDSARRPGWKSMTSYAFELSVIANDVPLIGGELPGRDPMDIASSAFELDDVHRPLLEHRIERIAEGLWMFETGLSDAVFGVLRRRGFAREN